MDITLYDFDADFESVKKKINKMNIPQSNKDVLLDFSDDCLNGWKMKRISLSRTTTLLQRLSRMTAVLGKEWKWFDETDTKKMLRWIDNEYPLPDGAWSQHGYRIALRKFVTWMRREHGYPKKYHNRGKFISALDIAKYAPEVAYINIQEPDKLKDVQKIPTDEEMDWLCEAALNPRDRAYIEMSREHGERIGGLGTRQIKHVILDDLGAKVIMHDKTFRGEPVRYMTSAMYLRQWLDAHPFKDNPEAPLWINLIELPKCVPLDYDGFRFIIYRLIKRHNNMVKKNGSGTLITKNITTHIFRYYAQTRDERNGVPRTIMCKLRGWKVNSKQPERYARLSSQDVDEYLKEQNGISSEEMEKKEARKVTICARCKTNNAPGIQYCSKCGLPLGPNAVMQLEQGAEMLQRLMNEDVIQMLIERRVNEIIEEKLKKKEDKP
jgi:ribosomal protein L40E